MSAYTKNLECAQSGEVLDCRTEIDTGTPELRMWLLVRRDIPMSLGKLAVQAGHGFGTCMWLAMQKNPTEAEKYISQAQSKAIVGVKSDAELISCIEACKEAGLIATTVTDAARTYFQEPTLTVGAVGPCYKDQLPKKVQRLRLFEGWDSINV